jgi:DNA-binding MltR family transcriptional regulator
MARNAMAPEQLQEQYTKMIEQGISEASPQAAALITGAFLESALVSLLSRFFIDSSTSKGLFKLGGTLSDFSACAEMAYCCGLIPKQTFQNLMHIAIVRNYFAHSLPPMDFDDDAIKKTIDGMVLPKITYVKVEPPKETRRQKFMSICTFLFVHIWMQTEKTDRRQSPGASDGVGAALDT